MYNYYKFVWEFDKVERNLLNNVINQKFGGAVTNQLNEKLNAKHVINFITETKSENFVIWMSLY